MLINYFFIDYFKFTIFRQSWPKVVGHMAIFDELHFMFFMSQKRLVRIVIYKRFHYWRENANAITNTIMVFCINQLVDYYIYKSSLLIGSAVFV